jgi:hypothetical protein
MNREIKFRVWDEAGKYFLYFNLEEIPHGCATCVAPPQQFTGLKDKNGKEIYEGDIIFVDDAQWEVSFDCGCFGIRANEKDKLTPLYQYDGKELLIIGNVFETPELLNGTESFKQMGNENPWTKMAGDGWPQ